MKQENVPVPGPYRDIHPFRYLDRDYFFGRERITQDLSAQILLHRLVVLFGDSGSGKSSLVNAGLIPVLEREGLRPERIRVRAVLKQPIQVERIPTGDTTGDYLPSLFVGEEWCQEAGHGAFVSSSLEEFVTAIVEQRAEARPVLIFDQFEELFTLFESGKEQSPELTRLQRSLLNGILQIVGNKDLRVKVLLNVREDFLGKLEVLAGDYPRVLDYRIRLRYLSADEAKIAILGPFGREEAGRNIIRSHRA